MHAWIKVIFFVHHNLQISSEKDWSIQRFEGEIEIFCFVVLWNDVKNESQCQNESRINSFDSTTIKINVRKPILSCFFDDDLRDQISWDDEENINANEPSWHEFRKGVKNYYCCDCNGPESINVRPVMMSLGFYLIFCWLWSLLGF